ncbi:MAG: tetratricopeptide repeat protein [Acidobacteriota bacterium]
MTAPSAMTLGWRELYEPAPVPRWLEAFDREPRDALDALLWQRFHHGRWQAAEPQDLLADWIRDLGARLSVSLDRELTAWIERNWRHYPDEPPEILADAWSILADVVSWSEGLDGTARALRERFAEARGFLGSLTISASQDPLGRYYSAVAQHQADRSLASFWWRLASLDEGTPIYHARYALEGLRGLPAPEGKLDTGYRPESVQVLARLARGFKRRADGEHQGGGDLRRYFLAVARLHLRSLPLPRSWERDLARVYRARNHEDAEWLRALVPKLKAGSTGEKPNPAWADRARDLSRSLSRRNVSAIETAERLLDEQRRYAQTTGEADEFLVRTLCAFAKKVWVWQPQRSTAWAREAVDWAPWDGQVWTTLVKSLLNAKQPATAIEIGWQARERFPQNPVVRNNLAEALGAGGRIDSAIAVYRETIELFPGDEVARGGLASTLKNVGDPEAAEAIYREAVERFPTNVVAISGLAGVLADQGELDAAERLYRQVLEMEPGNTVAQTGLRTVDRMRRVSAVAEPRASYDATSEATSPEIGEARLWRRRARHASGAEAENLRRRAADLLVTLREANLHEPRVLTESVLLALDSGAHGEAQTLLDGPASRLPSSVALLMARARFERESALAGTSIERSAEARLRDLDDPSLEPLIHLEEGRAALAAEGSGRLEVAARHLDRLRAWAAAQPRGGDDFAGWWAGHVAHRALDGKAEDPSIDPTDVEVLEAWQAERVPELDVLEEEFSLRYSAIRTEPELPT